jgi:hypothetical protein
VGDSPGPRKVRPAPVIVEPALVSASETVQDRLETQLAEAQLARAAAQKAERDSI